MHMVPATASLDDPFGDEDADLDFDSYWEWIGKLGPCTESGSDDSDDEQMRDIAIPAYEDQPGLRPSRSSFQPSRNVASTSSASDRSTSPPDHIMQPKSSYPPYVPPLGFGQRHPAESTPAAEFLELKSLGDAYGCPRENYTRLRGCNYRPFKKGCSIAECEIECDPEEEAGAVRKNSGDYSESKETTADTDEEGSSSPAEEESLSEDEETTGIPTSDQ